MLKKVKVVITLLGEQKLTKIIDNVSEDEVNEYIPVCGKSFALSEKTASSLIAKKFGKKCETPKKMGLPKK